jgi:predicted TIM-barrel fold metal-dependent hydrolase
MVCLMSLTLTVLALTMVQTPEPVIDVHVHAQSANDNGPPPLGLCVPPKEMWSWDGVQPWPQAFISSQKNPPCDDPVWSPMTDDELRDQTIAAMDRRNVYGVLSGPPSRVQDWMTHAPGRFIPGLRFRLGLTDISVDSLRGLHTSGRFQVLAEVSNQYAGITPSDERFDPYLTLAEELDFPVGIHVGTGPPGAPYLGFGDYRAALHSPLTAEGALIKHPRLRMYIMHAGWPMLDDMLAVMFVHPQVYVGLGAIIFAVPEPGFENYLRAIVEAGFGKRVMFGSDQMSWPGVIERGIQRIERADFLTEEQKRDILYNNAARFFRFTEEEIARHRRGG